MRHTLALLAALQLTPLVALRVADSHAAPKGDDRNSGDEAEPSQTRSKASGNGPDHGMRLDLAYWAPDRGTPYRWFEGAKHLQFSFSEDYLAAGYLYLYVRNDTKSPRTATGFAMDGRPLAELRKERKVIWWRLLPTPLPPGQVGEVMIRLRAPLRGDAAIRIGFDDGSIVETTIAPGPAPLRIETIGFTAAMDQVFLVVDRLKQSPHQMSRVWLDGEDVTARCQFLDPGFSTGVSPVTIRPVKPLEYGSYHTYRVATTEGVSVACSVRTYDGWVPLGSYGYGTYDEYARNGCNGHNNFGRHGKGDLDTHAALGMRAVMILGDQPPDKDLAGHPGVFAYCAQDEADVADYSAKEVPEPERIGYHAMETERRFQLYRQADPRHLSFLTVDLTYKPANYYIYAPIPDVVNSDCYPFVIGADARMVREVVEICRYAAAPRPVSFTFQGQYEEPTDPAAKAKQRFPRPPLASEERLMLHYAVGAGARGLFNYMHCTERSDSVITHGTREFPDLWREIGRTYRALDRVAPLLAVAHPTRLADTTDRKLWVATLLAGPSAVLLVVVNEDYEQQAKACRFHTKRDLTVELANLPWLNATCAWRVTETGFEPAELAAGRLKVRALEVADLYLFGERPELIGPLEARSREREAKVGAALLQSWRKEQARAGSLADLRRRLEGEFDDCVVPGQGVEAYGVKAERFWNPRALPYSGFEFGQNNPVPDRDRGARWRIAVPADQVGKELLIYSQATAWGRPARFRLTDPAGNELVIKTLEGEPPITVLRFTAGAAGAHELSYLQDGPGPKGGSTAQAIYVVPADRNPPETR